MMPLRAGPDVSYGMIRRKRTCGSCVATSSSMAGPSRYIPIRPAYFRSRRGPFILGTLRRNRRHRLGATLQELNIEGIAAHSPQAMGRIERSFQTAQDRLVKGLRRVGAKD